MNARLKKLLMFSPLILIAFAAFVALGGVVIRELWNWLLPPLFAWHTITLWQALGLLVLCRLLFGGFGMQGGPGPRARMRMWDRWDSMTPEERQRVREGMRGKFGFGSSAGESQGHV